MKGRDYLITVIAIGISIGFYYNHDMLQAEEVHLKEHPYFLTSEQFNLLYFCTYLAQFIFLIPLGILVDKFPLKIIMMLLIVFTLVTQTTLGILLSYRSDGYLTFMYWVRGIFGISGLGIIIIQGKLIDQFSKKHYEFIMGLCLNIPYCFNAINSFITSAVQQQTDSVPLCFFIGAAFCLISILFGIFCIIKFLNESQLSQSQLRFRSQSGFQLNALTSFKPQFWVLVLAIFLTEGSINSFIDNLSDFFVKSYGMETGTVGMMIPIVFIFLTPFSIILGKFVQHCPAQKRNMMILGRALYFGSLILLSLIPQTATPTSLNYLFIVGFLLIMSFNWAVFHSILQPCIAYYVEEKLLGTAWGVVGSALGLAQSIFSLMNICITSSSKSLLKSYEKLIIYYIILAGAAFLLACWIRLKDYTPLDKNLQQPTSLQEIEEDQPQLS